jgi:hypothetical protein
MLTWVLVVGFLMVSEEEEEEEEELRERYGETCKIGIVRKWGRLCFLQQADFWVGGRFSLSCSSNNSSNMSYCLVRKD